MKYNILTIRENSVIPLGYVGDESSTVIRIPISSLISKYGQGGEFELIHTPPDEIEGHPVSNITVSGGFIEWLVGSEELRNYGSGEAQVVYVCNDGIAHTKIWKTRVLRSLSDTGDIPQPWQPWVDRLYEYKTDAETAASHYPYIDEDTGNWFLWNPELGDWEDTGVSARGTADLPDDGTPGQVLTKTENGYGWADPQGEEQIQPDWDQSDSSAGDYINNKPFDSISGDTLIVTNGVLSVRTTDDAIEGSMLPITSSGVNTIVGNIDALLSLI